MNPNETQSEDGAVTDAVATLLRELPKPVQDFVLGPERARIAMSLSQKYNLHVDQAGEFETAFIHMLLGVSSPQEFAETLTRAGIASDVVAALAADVNREVFIPLREAEQSGSVAPEAVAPSPRPAPIAPPTLIETVPYKPVAPAEIPTVPAPVTSTPPENLPTGYSMPPQPYYAPQPPYGGYYMPPAPQYHPQAGCYMPSMPAQSQPMQWIPAQAAPLPPQSWANAPQPAPPPAPRMEPVLEQPRPQAPAPQEPRPVPAPPPVTKAEPYVPPAAPAPQFSPTPVVTAPMPVTHSVPDEPIPLTKNYSSDPYREPI